MTSNGRTSKTYHILNAYFGVTFSLIYFKNDEENLLVRKFLDLILTMTKLSIFLWSIKMG